MFSMFHSLRSINHGIHAGAEVCRVIRCSVEEIINAMMMTVIMAGKRQQREFACIDYQVFNEKVLP